ncbi:outer membrane protein [Litorilituus sediminis]|uniref:Outer membrane protein beta-barrel domain-containing protein n=1 Tax=Litorilituus sediminis TaxID=718192 RepID=A0A4P6P5I2_9GAMM|nr:outer membrane beta-barrel protein [Litorilituus sediminis]QBG36704.1 hypothetical protein EMK97_13735 [Litorilituus sediminis]
MRVLSLVCLSLAVAMPAIAKEKNEFEITPFIGYRFGGDFDITKDEQVSRVKLTEELSYGLITAWSYDRLRQGELLLSHYNANFSENSDFSPSDNDIAITYAHIGGNVAVSQSSVPLFVTGGLGFTHFSPKESGLDSETRFSMNLGLMTKMPLSENLSVQMSGRLYGTFFNSDSSIFCDDANCLISISSDIWVQTEVTVGLSYAF